MSDTMDKYLGKCLDDRYEILEVIGTGGMAVVYKARCRLLNRFVAIKVLRDDLALDGEFRRRFQTESQAVAMLSHPNIVSVHDVSRKPDCEYIVMELIEGIPLKQYMNAKGALTWNEALHFTTQVAKALRHAHGKGIVHRDIKPQNLMLLKDGTVKVADFGIAHLEFAPAVDAVDTVGSVHYISPEQARGETVDARSDIYSLGIVMYEMLTGKLPFEGETDDHVALQHLSAVAQPPREINPEIPEDLETIVAHAMNADINARYQTADDLLEDLEAFRAAQAALATVGTDAAVQEAEEPEEKVIRNVRPIGNSGELSKEAYYRRRRRAHKISLLSGFFGVIVFAIAVFVFLWNFWLKEVFQDPERINVPNFVGSYYSDIVDSEAFSGDFNFTVVFTVDPSVPEGVIIGQQPVAGKSLMLVSEGIDVELSVSSGVKMVPIPELFNKEYRTAKADLEALGFKVEMTTIQSQDVTRDYVISTNPAAGEMLASGSTVYMTVSAGPQEVFISMPNLIGLTEATAKSVLERNNLALGTISPIESEFQEGTIIWQSVSAYSEVAEHTKIYLQVSTGPAEPEETDEPDGGDASPASATDTANGG